jgi:hypothetical protein
LAKFNRHEPNHAISLLLRGESSSDDLEDSILDSCICFDDLRSEASGRFVSFSISAVISLIDCLETATDQTIQLRLIPTDEFFKFINTPPFGLSVLKGEEFFLIEAFLLNPEGE